MKFSEWMDATAFHDAISTGTRYRIQTRAVEGDSLFHDVDGIVFEKSAGLGNGAGCVQVDVIHDQRPVSEGIQTLRTAIFLHKKHGSAIMMFRFAKVWSSDWLRRLLMWMPWGILSRLKAKHVPRMWHEQ